MPVPRALVLSVVLLGLTQCAAGGAPSPNTLTEHEDRQFSKVKDYLKENNIHVHGFYHLTRLSPLWMEVFSEQLLLLSGFHRDQSTNRMSTRRVNVSSSVAKSRSGGLLSVLDGLRITDARLGGGRDHNATLTIDEMLESMAEELGPEAAARLQRVAEITTVPSVSRDVCSRAYAAAKDQRTVDALSRQGSCGEYPTITALRDHCVAEAEAGRQSIVFYAHLKSAYNQLPTQPALWRQAMSAVVLEYPSTCIRALIEGNSVCGMAFKPHPASHFSGNYWWASCNHIAKLPPLRHPLFYWTDPEMFVMRVGNRTADKVFAEQCAYDVVALDKHRRMFKTTVAYEDYASVVLDQIDSIHLPACGGITHTTRGVRLPACAWNGQKSHMLRPRKPCLSLKTPPGLVPSNVNYYGISSNPREAWGYSYAQEGQTEGRDTSDSAQKYKSNIENIWPLGPTMFE